MTFYRYSPFVIMFRSLRLSKQKKEDLLGASVAVLLFFTVAMLDGILNGIGY